MFSALSLQAGPRYKLAQLQGAWWSDFKSPTADFGISGDQVWLDMDAEYHPCRVEGDILIFDLGPTGGAVENRIISLKGDQMVLEGLMTKQRTTLTRVKK